MVAGPAAETMQDAPINRTTNERFGHARQYGEIV